MKQYFACMSMNKLLAKNTLNFFNYEERNANEMRKMKQY